MSLYYMFNKPRGCITARRDERQATVMDCFPEELRDVLFPVGRLDKDTEGFLLMTDDGMLSFRLMMPEHKVPKTYFFWVQGIPDPQRLSELEHGAKVFPTSDGVTAPARIKMTATAKLRDIKELLVGDVAKLSDRRGDTPVSCGEITVTEGKKHQVKRMLRYAGCRVVYLKRLKIGEVALDTSLAPGEYRPLTEGELLALRNA